MMGITNVVTCFSLAAFVSACLKSWKSWSKKNEGERACVKACLISSMFLGLERMQLFGYSYLLG